MNNYVPFLKLKTGEIGALSTLDGKIKSSIVPFIDLPKKDGMTPEAFKTLVDKGAKSIANHLKQFPMFFLDNFDIDDSLKVDGEHNYNYAIKSFGKINFSPVVGLDRAPGRNEAVFKAKETGQLATNTIALRLQSEDFENFSLVADEIDQLLKRGKGLFSDWVLVLDNRFCADVAPLQRASILAKFIHDSSAAAKFSAIIVTGSSMPPSIGDVTGVLTEHDHSRIEIAIYRALRKQVDGSKLFCGDYTIVSPLYSEVKLAPEVMYNVMTAKVVYSHGDIHYVARGGALKTHPRGNLQYNDIFAQIVTKKFYRKPMFSFGDKFIWDRTVSTGVMVTPASVLKPMINAHMSYMFSSFSA
ncbi:Beta protein [Burkholderia sp. WP9]|uniref:beta family protein n=1 Tax=Burkholderia sp. WP9 TaxID=1500263 RepID=UPI00089A7998|nr:beta family protein [Burkholderia sp. WP9]SED24894.1 Beta protein [Burkholderia sp. WP9]